MTQWSDVATMAQPIESAEGEIFRLRVANTPDAEAIISAPESPAAPSQAAPGQAATPVTIPISPAALAYRKGDAAALAALANASSDPDERLALEWAALRTDPHPPEAVLAAYA